MDSALAQLEHVLKLGDRLALRRYCDKQSQSAHKTSTVQISTAMRTRRQSLLDKLRKDSGLSTAEADENPQPSSRGRGNMNAFRECRRIQVGWIHNDQQVKSSRGGGVRKLDVSKEANPQTLLESTTNLFFRDGISKKGLKLKYCSECCLKDFSHCPLKTDTTVGDLYRQEKPNGILRFYLHTTSPYNALGKMEEETQPAKRAKTNHAKDDEKKNDKAETVSTEWQVCSEQDLDNEPTVSSAATSAELEAASTSLETHPPPAPHPPSLSDSSQSPSPVLPTHLTQSPVPSRQSSSQICRPPSRCSAISPPLPTSLIPHAPNLPPGSPTPLHRSPTPPHRSPTPPRRSSTPPPHSPTPPPCSVTPSPRSPTPPPRSPTPPPRSPTLPPPSPPPLPGSPIRPHRSATPPPYTPTSTSQVPSTTPVMQSLMGAQRTITLHRGNILVDMINVFKDPYILDIPLLFRFQDEIGADASGVSREAYTAFWNEFYLTSSSGETARVPAIHPEFGWNEWSAAGRILLKGFQDLRLFPTCLSSAFVTALILGECAVSDEMLIGSYRAFLSPLDAEIINKALCDEMTEEDKEDLLDILSRADCHTVPSSENMRETLISAAHKELIQVPKYALDSMAATARADLHLLLPTMEAVFALYEETKPTPRKLIRLIKATPTSRGQEQALGFLKQFIRSLDSPTLRKFIRFCTGAEILCFESLFVEFCAVKKGAGRCPVAHTCGPTLVLPSSYMSYNELRCELSSILDSGYLKMDIV